ncbi:MAG: ribonuclease H [Acidimicrobiales bacterium]
MTALRIYTDGACSGNPGPGGWAWASSADHHASGGEPDTTNNRMELTAVLRAIEDNSGSLVVVMDSTYVKNGLESWSKGWVRNGWKTKAGESVKNRDLWEELLAVLADRPRGEVSFEWVKGHSGDLMNELVDGLAVVQRDAHRPGGAGAADGSGSVTSNGGTGGGKLSDLPPDEQRAERRRRDPRIPAGWLLAVFGHTPDRLGGWDDNPVADRVRSDLVEVIDALARIHPDLVVVTGIRPGAELLAAEAAQQAEVPYAAVVGFPGIDRNLSAAARERGVAAADRAASVVRLERKEPSDVDGFRRAMRRRDAWIMTAADEAVLVWDEVDDRLERLHADLDVRLGAGLTVLHPPG